MIDRGRSVSDVLQDIVANVQEIVRCELHLATAEIRTEVTKAAGAGKIVGAGAVLAVMALMFLLLSGVYALMLVMPAWLAALSVAILLVIAASILISAGNKRLKMVHLKPEKTFANIRETLHG